MSMRRGRRPTWSEEERERVLRLAAEGRSQREIAEVVFGDARYRGRVERILRRPPERARPAEASLAPEGTPAEVEGLPSSAADAVSIDELVARYEQELARTGAVPSLSEIERLLRIKRQLRALADLERLNALTRASG